MEDKREKILKQIKELAQELKDIELYEKKLNNADKVGLGDYILHYTEDWQLAEICIDDDGMFRLYYPMYKELVCDTYDTIEHLFTEYIKRDKTIVHIPIKTDRVKFLEHGKLYFIYKKCNDLHEWKIMDIDIEQEIAIAYNVKDESDIIQADNLDDLFIKLLKDSEYIAEIFEEK